MAFMKKKLIKVFLLSSFLTSCLLIAIASTTNDRETLISYTIYVDGGDELINCLEGYSQPRFILYDDGHLIVYRNKQYWETILRQEEVNSLLNIIKDTGIFEVGEVDIGGFDKLIIKEKTYRFSHSNFFSKSIEETMDIINQFQPSSLEPYIPDNLVLWIFPVELTMPFEEFLPKPIPQVDNWSLELNPLSEFHEGFRDIRGEILLDIMNQYNGFPDYQIFKEGETLYVTAICANFDGFGSYLPSEP